MTTRSPGDGHWHQPSRASQAGSATAPRGIDGVAVRDLTPHLDHRGRFVEIYRREWPEAMDLQQWNVVTSATGVLRGIHVHLRHHDAFSLVSGAAVIGLVDLRGASGTFGRSATLEVSGDRPQVLGIPPGVAHGFWFTEPSVHVYGVSEYFDPADELAFRWDSPGHHIGWPAGTPHLSERDRTAPELHDVIGRFTSYG